MESTASTWRRLLPAGIFAVLLAAALSVVSPAPRAAAIGGGEPADPIASEFVARLSASTRPFGAFPDLCTGSLVAPRLVLTAAHCISTMRPSDWDVSFGHGTDRHEERGVERVEKFSPEAGAWNGGTSIDDLAVLVLDEPVLDRRPVALDRGSGTVDRLTSIRARVVEYGYGWFRENRRAYSLKQGELVLAGPTVDSVNLTGSRTVPPPLLAAVDPGFDSPGFGPTGRCLSGDSGGPLMSSRPDGSVLLGVLSTGTAEEDPDDPGAWNCYFTRVDNGDPYRAWLDAVIAAHGA